jgi:hypothetical protein
MNRNFLAILYCLEPHLFFLSFFLFRAAAAKAFAEPIYALLCLVAGYALS